MEPFHRTEGLKYMTPNRARSRLVLLVGVAALGLAACNSSPAKPPSTTSTTTQPPAGTRETATTTPTSTTTTTAAAVGSSVRGGCAASQLSAKPGLSNGATGHIGQVVTLTNTSKVTCTLDGYPGLQMLSASNQVIPTTVLRTPSVVVQPQTPTKVTMPPGQRASFVLGYADQTGYGNNVCPTSAKLEVTPPNDYGYLVVPDKVSAYGPSLGQCGAINVSPVYLGTGAQP